MSTSTKSRAKRAPVKTPPDLILLPSLPGASPTSARARAANAPAPATVSIDPASPKAKDALFAAYPYVVRHVVRDSSDPGLAEVAREYLAISAEEARLARRKETLANVLRAAIAGDEGIRVDGAIVTWADRDGSVDWGALAIGEGIDRETTERYRRPPTRALSVRAEGGGS